MIGLVEPLDPPEALVDAEPGAVDLLPVGDDARDRAEAARDPHRARVGEGRQPAVEHARVELVGLAVDVEIGAREAGRHQRRAERHDVGKQRVDEGVLRAPERHGVEPRGGKERARIDGAGVRRVEDERNCLPGGLQHVVRRLEIGLGCG